MVSRYLLSALASMLSNIPVLIALAAGIAVSAMNLKRRPKAAAAGLIAFSGFLLLELVLPVLNFGLMGYLIKLERTSTIAVIQGALRIISSVLSAGLWAAVIYGFYYAEGKENQDR